MPAKAGSIGSPLLEAVTTSIAHILSGEGCGRSLSNRSICQGLNHSFNVLHRRRNLVGRGWPQCARTLERIMKFPSRSTTE